jgi:hypothetical protein
MKAAAPRLGTGEALLQRFAPRSSRLCSSSARVTVRLAHLGSTHVCSMRGHLGDTLLSQAHKIARRKVQNSTHLGVVMGEMPHPFRHTLRLLTLERDWAACSATGGAHLCFKQSQQIRHKNSKNASSNAFCYLCCEPFSSSSCGTCQWCYVVSKALARRLQAAFSAPQTAFKRVRFTFVPVL